MKKPLLIAILAAVLAVLVVAAVLLETLLLVEKPSEEGAKTPIELIDGEAYYDPKNKKTPIAYPEVHESDIDFILIRGENEYSFLRYPIDGNTENPPFLLSYVDANGKQKQYIPSIMLEDPNFEYSDMYALEQNDGYGTITKLKYLCAAVRLLYFDERMALSADESVKEKQLKAYGLAPEDNPIKVSFSYTDDNGESKNHTVTVGDRLVTDRGYYFMVDDRAYVYTTYSPYLDYAFLNFNEYIQPILVAEGLPQDKAFEPFLTTDFQQWTNTLYEPNPEKNYYPTVIPGSSVVVGAKEYDPKNYNKTDVKAESIQFELKELLAGSEKGKIASILEGKATGQISPIRVTVPGYTSVVDLSQNLTYRYEITSIEAILTSGADSTDATVGATDKVLVGYTLYKTGKEPENTYGVIDLNMDATFVPENVKNALIGRGVCEFAAGERPVFEKTYNEGNTISKSVTMVITKILRIVDKNDISVTFDAVKTGSKVAFSCYYIVDGEKTETTDEFILEIDESMSDDEKLVADALMGKSVSENLEIKVNAYQMNAEVVASFVSYDISEIKYFVTSEKIVSFKFEQASKRNDFYGETFYTNTMGDEYALYALNAASCESVVKVLGGLLTDASRSTGLVGTKTVDVVLTPEKMYKYNLYDYTVYFELPRGITEVEFDQNENMDEYLTKLDDYKYYSTLGFTLYISRQDPVTGKRYIASDLYDLVAEIDGDNFIFLEQNFVDFYARKDIAVLDITNLGRLDLEFMMDDVYGSYSNKLNHTKLYYYNGEVYSADALIAAFGQEVFNSAVSTEFNGLDIVVSPTANGITTEFSKYLETYNCNEVSLYNLYGNKPYSTDSLGTAQFREFIETLFCTQYQNTLTEAEQAAGLANGKLVMRMTLSLTDDAQGKSANDYVYEFYRISDRRVMVKLYQKNSMTGQTGPSVSDFYLSTPSFKRLVNKYFGVLNAQLVDNEEAYPEDSFLNK